MLVKRMDQPSTPFEPPATVSARLALARLEAGITARRLDRLAHKAEGVCAIIEARGDDSLQRKTAEPYCNALGIPLEWLLLGVGPTPDWDDVRARVPAEETEHLANKVTTDRGPEYDQTPAEAA